MLRFIALIEQPCLESRFLARNVAIPFVSLLGFVGGLSLLGEVDRLWSSRTLDVRFVSTHMTCDSIDRNVSNRMVLVA